MKNSVRALLLSLLLPVGNVAAGRFELRDITNVGWSAEYLGCEYEEGSDQASYSYEVTVASGEKDLSHWVLVLDESLPPIASTGGSTVSFGPDPTTETYGFKWDDGQSKGTSAVYSLTFAGNCNEGTISYAVKGGTYYAVGSIEGPVADPVSPPGVTYSIGGVVFIDANGNGVFDGDEPVVPDAAVVLQSESDGADRMATTSADGRYLFAGNNPGHYDVMIPVMTDEDNVNDMLHLYSVTASSTQSVTLVDTDILDVDFGFNLNIEQILNDIDTSDPDGNGYSFAGVGKTIGFWKHQHSVVLKGKGKAQVDAATLLAYLVELETLWLADLFNFGANKIANSLDILSARTSNSVELLLKQLVAIELNHLSGLGLLDAMPLQSLIIHYAEYIAANEVQYSRADILQMKDLLDAINNSGH